MKTQTYAIRSVVSRKILLNLSTDLCVIIGERLAGYLHWGAVALQAPEHTGQEHVQVHGIT